MKKIVLASDNKKKLAELKFILEPLGFLLLSKKEAGMQEEIEENGSTFEENSYIKAKSVYDFCGLPTIADDSGLSVDALGGAPGIYSARYAGEGKTDKDRNDLLLYNMKDIPEEKRGAKFVCAITFIYDKDKHFTVVDECRGRILFAPEGQNGFGYDPLFYVEEFGKTFASLTDSEKASVSHRGKALRTFAEKLKEL